MKNKISDLLFVTEFLSNAATILTFLCAGVTSVAFLE